MPLPVAWGPRDAPGPARTLGGDGTPATATCVPVANCNGRVGGGGLGQAGAGKAVAEAVAGVALCRVMKITWVQAFFSHPKRPIQLCARHVHSSLTPGDPISSGPGTCILLSP